MFEKISAFKWIGELIFQRFAAYFVLLHSLAHLPSGGGQGLKFDSSEVVVALEVAAAHQAAHLFII